VAAAFAMHVVLAVSAGSLPFLLPHRVLQAVVAVLFVVGAVPMRRRRDEDPDGKTRRIGRTGYRPVIALRLIWGEEGSPRLPGPRNLS
jgi:putative Ca2+/H+ antiporter (TMEM165/GDT1 family)